MCVCLQMKESKRDVGDVQNERTINHEPLCVDLQVCDVDGEAEHILSVLRGGVRNLRQKVRRVELRKLRQAVRDHKRLDLVEDD